MDYIITIYKRPGIYSNHPLYAVWIDAPDAEPQPGAMWEAVQQMTVTTKQPIPKVLRGQILMTEATSDDLFRDVYDTWVKQ
jgi:hypothetical protein